MLKDKLAITWLHPFGSSVQGCCCMNFIEVAVVAADQLEDFQ